MMSHNIMTDQANIIDHLYYRADLTTVYIRLS